MTIQQIIADVIRREGDKFTNNPVDKGGPTKFGITAATLGKFRELGRPATVAEVKALERPEAERIYYRVFVIESGFHLVPGETLRAQLVDFGVNSGPARAVRWLQRAIGFPAEFQTGKIDARTISTIRVLPEALVNNALVAARAKMIDDWSDADREQKQFEEGVESRALSFFLG